MRLSPSLVYRWAQPPSDRGTLGSGVRNPLDRVAELLAVTEDHELVQWMCARAGGFFVANPVAQANANLAVLHQTQEMIQEFSDLLEAVSNALANDEFVDLDEAESIRHAWEQLKRGAETFTVACERGCFSGPKTSK